MPRRAPSRCSVFGCSAMATNRGRCAAHQPRPWERRSQARGDLDRALWERARKEHLRMEPACVECGSTSRLEVDHIVAIADGGALYDHANLQTLCHVHHGVKTAQENSARAARARAERDPWT